MIKANIWSVLSIVLVVFMVFTSFCIPASALESTNYFIADNNLISSSPDNANDIAFELSVNNISSVTNVTNHLIDDLDQLLKGISDDEAIKNADNVYLGKPFQTVTLSTYADIDVNPITETSISTMDQTDDLVIMYPIFCDDTLSYIITVIRYNDNYSYTIDTDIANVLDDFALNNSDYILCVEDNESGSSIFALSNNTINQGKQIIQSTSLFETKIANNISDLNQTIINVTDDLNVECYIDCDNFICNINSILDSITSTEIIGESLDVVNRSEGTIENFPVIGQGSYSICWAACTAAIYNYKYNDSYTALSIIDDYRESTGVNTPYSTITYEYFRSTFFPHYLSNYSNYTVLENGPEKSFIINKIDSNKPIIMSSYFENDTDYDGTGYHITVLYGYIDSDSYDYVNIKFMDPYGGVNHSGSNRIGYFSTSENYYAYTWGGSKNFRFWKKSLA